MYYQGSNSMMEMNNPSQGQGQGQGQGYNSMYDPNQHIQHPLGPGQGMYVCVYAFCTYSGVR